jgi:C-terminal processing protease CtpA/Prc
MKLGLSTQIEEEVRRSELVGMLVAKVVVPKGPAATAGLQQGDILVRVGSLRWQLRNDICVLIIFASAQQQHNYDLPCHRIVFG